MVNYLELWLNPPSCAKKSGTDDLEELDGLYASLIAKHIVKIQAGMFGEQVGMADCIESSRYEIQIAL